MSSETLISVENVCKDFLIHGSPLSKILSSATFGIVHAPTRFRAIDNVNFSVARGESVAILGLNGSGKSTLLQMIAGTMTPSSGQIVRRGRVVALLELGAGFAPDFTGRENAVLNARLLGLTAAEVDGVIDEIAAFADIGDAIDRPVRHYSSGMFARLAFAVAVAIRPDVLIVDEALSVGDAAFQRRCQHRIREMQQDGATLLFVSHSEDTIRRFTDRAILLSKGRIIEDGPSDAVVVTYRSMIFGAAPPDAPKSFGTDAVSIDKVALSDAAGTPRPTAVLGMHTRISVSFTAKVALDRLNVSLRVLNGDGTRLYSWGTLIQDKHAPDGRRFCDLRFSPNQSAIVHFDFECRLGVGDYEIQTFITREGAFDHFDQEVLRWTDDALRLSVVEQVERTFIGAFDLRMSSEWSASGEPALQPSGDTA